jgi:hypothetical protein
VRKARLGHCRVGRRGARVPGEGRGPGGRGERDDAVCAPLMILLISTATTSHRYDKGIARWNLQVV